MTRNRRCRNREFLRRLHLIDNIHILIKARVRKYYPISIFLYFSRNILCMLVKKQWFQTLWVTLLLKIWKTIVDILDECSKDSSNIT